MKRVLVIDDEIQIRRLLKISLRTKEYEVFEATTGFEGLQELKAKKPDIILLDLNLPDEDGLSVLRTIREWSTVPIIILSIRSSKEDIISLLNAGADDYLIKPFDITELVARMNVALRRRRPDLNETTFRTGGLSIDFEKRIVKVDEVEIKLTPTEYGILSLLSWNADRIVTRERILQELWGPTSDSERGNLRVYISFLRKKIEKNPSNPELLVTEPGIGYRLLVKKP